MRWETAMSEGCAERAKAAFEQFFLDQYKVEFGSKLLSEPSVEVRLSRWEAWVPDAGQRAQAEANAALLLDRLGAAGVALTDNSGSSSKREQEMIAAIEADQANDDDDDDSKWVPLPRKEAGDG
jgi:hypothetical protein